MGWPVAINGNTYNQADFSPYGYVTAFPNIIGDVATVTGKASADYLAFAQAVASGPVVGVNGLTGAAKLPLGSSRIVNGDMRYAQRGTTLTTASGGIILDRWQLLVQSAGTVTFSQESTQEVGVDRVIENFLRCNIPALAGGNVQVIQKIEGVRSFAGRRVTAVFKAKADINGSTFDRLQISQNFGTGGSATVINLNAGPFTLTTAFQEFTATFTMPNVNGKTIGSNSFITLAALPKLAGVSTNAKIIDFTDVKLDESDILTQAPNSLFSTRDYQVEQAMCERHLQRVPVELSAVATAAGQVLRQSYPLTRMAKPPAVTFSTAGSLTNGTAALSAGPDPTGGFTVSVTSAAAGPFGITGAIVNADAEF